MRKLIERSYLETLKRVSGTPDIKVITGVRRSGKSVLLSMFEEYVRREVKDANVISIDFNSVEFDDLRTYRALHDYVTGNYRENKHNFVLIDEVQMCEGFERAINSLHAAMKYDIYLTGSNAFLQNSDLATLFVGRTFSVKVFPFSLSEYRAYHQGWGEQEVFDERFWGREVEGAQEAFDGYFREGGFAGAYAYQELNEKYAYISDIYDTLIVRDIQQKYHIQNPPVLSKVSDFLMDNISNLTTGRGIANALQSNGQNISHSTVDMYLKYLCDAFAFYKVKRFDVKGKTYLYSQDKYYLCDHVMKYARLGTEQMDIGRAYENIVAIELLRRGYEVYVGTLRDKEIDFVASRPNEKIYIQVSANIDFSETFEREMAPLMAIRDAYPRLLIARTKQPPFSREGVRVVDIAEWLLGRR